MVDHIFGLDWFLALVLAIFNLCWSLPFDSTRSECGMTSHLSRPTLTKLQYSMNTYLLISKAIGASIFGLRDNWLFFDIGVLAEDNV